MSEKKNNQNHMYNFGISGLPVSLWIIPQKEFTMNDGSILVCHSVQRLQDYHNVEITLLDGEIYTLPITDFKDIFEVNRASLPW
jgi:hypothetical protein